MLTIIPLGRIAIPELAFENVDLFPADMSPTTVALRIPVLPAPFVVWRVREYARLVFRIWVDRQCLLHRLDFLVIGHKEGFIDLASVEEFELWLHREFLSSCIWSRLHSQSV